MNFKKLSDQAPSTEKFTFVLGSKGNFTYPYKNPFIPLLFWNQVKPRVVVSPRREWLDPICPTCAKANDTLKTIINLDRLIEKGTVNFTKSHFEAAVKLKLHSMGINVYGRTVTNAYKWLEKVMGTGKFDIEDLAVKLDLKVRKTRLRKGIEDAIEIIGEDLPISEKSDIIS